MSYDVTIGDFEANYTCNLSPLFLTHIDGGLLSLNGMTGKQASRVLALFWQSVISEMREDSRIGQIGHPVFCRKYDAQNGWGSAVGALGFMGQLTAACSARPRHRVRVSA